MGNHPYMFSYIGVETRFIASCFMGYSVGLVHFFILVHSDDAVILRAHFYCHDKTLVLLVGRCY
ncbi:MAG: hypothetical protein KAS93_03840 [Gammaproteobacteria bacterium]|nr:hypothetical protein [Gammaproteobacteria bacterium]